MNKKANGTIRIWSQVNMDWKSLSIENKNEINIIKKNHEKE